MLIAVVLAVVATARFTDAQEQAACQVANIIAAVHAEPHHPRKDRDRFVIVAEPNGDYAQCLFQDGDTWMFCEASSSYWYDKRVVRPEQRSALAVLGFNTLPYKSNFQKVERTPEPASFTRIARLLVETVSDVYAGDPNVRLEVKAGLLDAPALKRAMSKTCEAAKPPS